MGRGDFDRYAAPYTTEYLAAQHFPTSLVDSPKHISDALGDALVETIQQLHSQRKPFYLQFHTYAVHGPVKARPDLLKAAKERTDKKVKTEYLGFISSVDLNLSRMLAAIEDPNGDGDTADSIAANTLILFTSDNGGTHADNLPLKGVKGMFTEGGVRVPLIAYWPGVVAPGGVTDCMIHAVDYYPTCLELAGGKWKPATETHPLDGESFAGILHDSQSTRARNPVFYLFPGYLDTRAQPCVVAIDDIAGKRYKLFYYYESDSWELYCLSDDQSEARNLIETEAGVAATLSRKIREWLTQRHPTWKPKYPIVKQNGESAGPPPLL